MSIAAEKAKREGEILAEPKRIEILTEFGYSMMGKIPHTARKKYKSKVVDFAIGKKLRGVWLTLENGNSLYRLHGDL